MGMGIWLHCWLGSFVNLGKKFLPNLEIAGTAIAMALGAIVMIIIAFSYAYMIPKYPKAGGEFTFTKECYGKNMVFICGFIFQTGKNMFICYRFYGGYTI